MAMKRKNKKVVQKGKKVKFGPEKTEERKTSSYAAKENYVGTFRWAKLQGLKMMWPVLVKSITPDKVLVYVKSDDDMKPEKPELEPEEKEVAKTEQKIESPKTEQAPAESVKEDIPAADAEPAADKQQE